MSVDQNKRKTAVKLDLGTIQELEQRISHLEGLGQQTIRYGTKIRSVRQPALLATDLMRLGHSIVTGDAGNLVVLDGEGWLVDSGYTPTELIALIAGADTAAMRAYRSAIIQEVHTQVTTKVRFTAETFDVDSEFIPHSEFVEVAPQLGGLSLRCLCAYNGKLYAGTDTTGELYEWNGTDAWVQVAPQLAAETHIRSLCVYNNKLYGGTQPNGNLYEWNGSNAWIQKAPQFGAEQRILSLCVYNSKLYGGTNPNGNLFEWNGVNAWVQKAPQLAGQTDIWGLCVFNGKLHGSTGGGGRLFEWNDVNLWVQRCAQLGAEVNIKSLLGHNDLLYGGTAPNGKLYQYDGAVFAWTEVAPQLGAEGEINRLALFNNALYGGTFFLCRLFRWNDVDAWEEMASQAGAETHVFGIDELNDKLYVATHPSGKLYEWGAGLGKFVAADTGKYLIHANIGFTSTNIVANKKIKASIYKNGTEIARAITQSSVADIISISVTTETEIVEGDEIEIYVYHDMGATCEIDYNDEKTYLEIRKVR